MEENKPVEINSPPGPMELSRQVELNVYAIASVKKDMFDREMMAQIKDKLMISLSLAYSDAEAAHGAAHGIQALGYDPGVYVIPSAIISKSVKNILEITGNTKTPFPGLPVITPKTPEEPKEKSNDDMIAYVKFIFDLCGTKKQKEVAEVVIKKFQDHVKAIGQK